MLRNTIALVIAGRLVLAPWAAARDAPPAGPIAAAAAREAARTDPQPARGPMPDGLKWTGVSLLAASLLPVTVAALGDCVPDEFRCRDKRAAAYVAGGVMAGTGALLLAIGHARRDAPAPLPSVGLRPGRVSITQRVTF